MTYEECLISLEIIYQSALDVSKSSYPSYADGTKTFDEFKSTLLASFDKENEKVLVFHYHGQECAWVHYLFEEESQYCGIISLQAQDNMTTFVQAFLNYLEDNYQGYECYLGFSKKNTEAIQVLKTNSFEIVDAYYHGILHLKDSKEFELDLEVTNIGQENYEEFQILHDQVASTMYWNSKRIYHSLNRWNITMVSQTAMYSISIKNMLEIFGFDTPTPNDHLKEFEILLKSHINYGIKERFDYLVFFVDDAHTRSLENHGFTLFGEYRCLVKRL